MVECRRSGEMVAVLPQLEIAAVAVMAFACKAVRSSGCQGSSLDCGEGRADQLQLDKAQEG